MKKWLVVCILFLGMTGEVRGEELLDDVKFSKGMSIGYANTYTNTPLESDCIQRWKNVSEINGVSYSNIKWSFIEISERFYFCEKDQTSSGNPIIEPNKIEYISPNYAGKTWKTDRNGTVRMTYNTGWEWRGGCNLSRPWNEVTPSTPRFGDVNTNWPHFLMSQILSPSYVPSQYDTQSPSIVKPEERIALTETNKIMFNGEFRMNKLSKVGNGQCPSDDWIPAGTPNHAIFYVSFVLWKNTWDFPRIANEPNVVYLLLPLAYSNDGVVNIGGDSEYLMGDQFGDRTYFAKLGEGVTANAKKLTMNGTSFEKVSVDVSQLSKQVLRNINPNIDTNKYFIGMLLTGWEIWGGYETDVEVRNLSLTGTRGTNAVGGVVGDTNGDGKVDLVDFSQWKDEYMSKTKSKADFNNDGVVNLIDFSLWKDGYLKK